MFNSAIVISVDLSPAGNILATGSGDWQARICMCNSGISLQGLSLTYLFLQGHMDLHLERRHHNAAFPLLSVLLLLFLQLYPSSPWFPLPWLIITLVESKRHHISALLSIQPHLLNAPTPWSSIVDSEVDLHMKSYFICFLFPFFEVFFLYTYMYAKNQCTSHDLEFRQFGMP